MNSKPHDRIALVGAGSLGCALIARLLRMPIQGISIIDGDLVESDNLERQPLYSAGDIGSAKSAAARSRVHAGAPGIAIAAVDRFLDAGNADELLIGHGIVADCTDDLHAKALIDRTCARLGTVLVSGALHRDQGQVLVLHAPGDREGLSRADLFTGRVGAGQDGCDMRLVHQEAIEAVAARMAVHIRSLLAGEPVACGRLEIFETLPRQWTSYQASVN
ncbi:MAG: ThiF family adenylyltransferase [Flavobacteriales bacterium]|nr:ThiF family adenylyltransferase [Flavobacteriales bacterium]